MQDLVKREITLLLNEHRGACEDSARSAMDPLAGEFRQPHELRWLAPFLVAAVATSVAKKLSLLGATLMVVGHNSRGKKQ